MKLSLKKILNEQDLALSSILMALEARVNSYADIAIDLPHLTDHSYHHYKAIENFLDQIIPDDIMKSLPEQLQGPPGVTGIEWQTATIDSPFSSTTYYYALPAYHIDLWIFDDQTGKILAKY